MAVASHRILRSGAQERLPVPLKRHVLGLGWRGGAEDALEEGVDGAELAFQVEGVLESFRVEVLRYVGIARDAIAEAGFGFPRRHGVALHPLVSILARRAMLDEVLQHLT